MEKSKIKILFVTNHLEFGNGVANALVELANALDKNKFDITIMTIYRCDNEYIKKFDKSIKIKKIFNGYFTGLSKFVRLLPQGILYRFWIKDKYDIEIAYQYGTPTEVLARSKNKKAKHIAWMHGYGEEYLKLHKKFDKIVCCSKSSMESYIKSFEQPYKVTYLYNLINDNLILEKSKADFGTDKEYDFTFCTVGRLSPEKGFDRLLKCHKRLIEEGFVHNLWIVGGGAEFEKLNDYVAENHLNKSVRLYGHQNNPYPYMLNSNMFVCSSYSEGFSTVCVEAGILGKSILTTEVSGAKEFVADNNIGIIVDNSTEALYQGLRSILLDKNCVKQFEQNLEKVKDMHYSDRLIAVENFFERLNEI